MAEQKDEKYLHVASDGTKRDYEGSIYNENNYLVSKSPDRIAREAQSVDATPPPKQTITVDYSAQEKQWFKDAVKKAGGLVHLPRFNLNLGFAGLLLIGFFVLSFLTGIKLFLDSPDGKLMIRNIGDFFSQVGFHLKAFLFAWPQTFSEMFKHWFYLPELLLGVYLLYHLIKTADDDDFYREDGVKCIVPYLLIEVIHAVFLKDPNFTRLACVLRGLGLGIGLCLIVKIARKILIHN